jgi:hypothetical protein
MNEMPTRFLAVLRDPRLKVAPALEINRGSAVLLHDDRVEDTARPLRRVVGEEREEALDGASAAVVVFTARQASTLLLDQPSRGYLAQAARTGERSRRCRGPPR